MAPRIEPIVCHYGTDGRVMAYYVDAPCPTLIDTGGAAHPEGPIRAALQARGTDLAAIGAIINTHGHWDHAGGNAATVAASGAGVLIHEFGAPFLFDHRAHLEGYYTEAQRALEQPALVAAQRAAFPTIFGAEMVPGRLLGDGDRLDLGAGVTLQAIYVPGHSDDAIALWWEREGILFTGDAAQGTGSRPGAGPLYFATIAQARASIARLRAIPFRTLHTSHFFGRPGATERQAGYDAAAGRAFLDDSLVTLDAVAEALRTALRENPEEATFSLLARAASEHLIASTDWGLVADPLTGVPDNLAPTLYRLWQEIER
jgi:glyoxylase-like metal-dependent hydrolase (beta-lactamase superfamily II)